jgi:UDP-N-acetyl-D-mannosaminuronate dehydrogenase
LDLIVGVGEVGTGLTQLFNERHREISGYDVDPKRCFGNPEDIVLMHICIPFSSQFISTVIKYVHKWMPKGVVIHSTVQPMTTKQLHEKLPDENVVYSPVRGVHTRMLFDLKRYTKFYSSYSDTDERLFQECFKDVCGLEIERFSTPLALEMAKLMIGSSYYGWLIIYGQLVDKICVNYELDYDELWRFAEEIHMFLGNRPKVYVDPKGIGGHCILPNLDLIENTLPELKDIIIRINEETKKRYNK